MKPPAGFLVGLILGGILGFALGFLAGVEQKNFLIWLLSRRIKKENWSFWESFWINTLIVNGQIKLWKK